jgi:hypothetical protein
MFRSCALLTVKPWGREFSEEGAEVAPYSEKLDMSFLHVDHESTFLSTLACHACTGTMSTQNSN